MADIVQKNLRKNTVLMLLLLKDGVEKGKLVELHKIQKDRHIIYLKKQNYLNFI